MARMEEKPKTRWLRFSLRTMFLVVTAVCCWLAWQLSVVRERRDLLNDLNASRGFQIVKASEWAKDTPAADQPVPAIPWIREWLGDEAIQSIWFPPERDPDEY